jgi:hypothetical protein
MGFFRCKALYGHLQENLGKWWAHQDSNLGPTGYEPVALAN